MKAKEKSAKYVYKKAKLRDTNTLYCCQECAVRHIFISWGQTGKMQSKHHFSLLIPISAQTLCRTYECKMFHILSTVAVLFSLIQKTH